MASPDSRDGETDSTSYGEGKNVAMSAGTMAVAHSFSLPPTPHPL